MLDWKPVFSLGAFAISEADPAFAISFSHFRSHKYSFSQVAEAMKAHCQRILIVRKDIFLQNLPSCNEHPDEVITLCKSFQEQLEDLQLQIHRDGCYSTGSGTRMALGTSRKQWLPPGLIKSVDKYIDRAKEVLQERLQAQRMEAKRKADHDGSSSGSSA